MGSRHGLLRETAGGRTLNRTHIKTEAVKTPSAQPLLERILKSLDEDKAEEIATIDLAGRSSLCDAIVVANGRSQRHVAAIAEHLARRLKDAGYGTCHVEGLPQGDWVLVDAGDVIAHIFRPEVRAYYDIEGLWSVEGTPEGATGGASEAAAV